jgi:tetraacyldisaccharide 4'-kinase
MRSALERALTALWYRDTRPPALLRGLARIYAAEAQRRARAATRVRVGRPVLVVGNLTVGGTGKTPLVIALALLARDMGLRPGVVSRGYGGRRQAQPLSVEPDSRALEVGDEPLLIARRTGVPVMVHASRVLAAQALIARGDIDLVIADDGLQHHALARDGEICVVDGQRGFGNGYLLPAGPLREPLSRLQRCDLVVVNGDGAAPAHPRVLRMQLQAGQLRSIDGHGSRDLDSFSGQTVHAVAGIGNPQRFFATLRAAGLLVVPHAFPDHYALGSSDLHFGDGAPVLLTEKDAVKLGSTAAVNVWQMPVTASFGADDEARMRHLISSVMNKQDHRDG